MRAGMEAEVGGAGWGQGWGLGWRHRLGALDGRDEELG